MTGDENPYPTTSRNWVRSLMGDEIPKDLRLAQVCRELAALYHPFFLIPDPGRVARCEKPWRKVLGDQVICLQGPQDICLAAAALVALCEGSAQDLDAVALALAKDNLDPKRIDGIVGALTPFANTLTHKESPFARLQQLICR